MPVHSSIAHADCHEPKHITPSLTSDSGKVITPSSTLAGVSELRNLVVSEITGLQAALDAASLRAYSGKTINNNSTATTFASPASDPTFQTAGDYMQVTGIFESPEVAPSSGVTRGTNDLTIDTAGVYRVDFWTSVTSDTNSNQVALNFGLNGTVSTERSLIIRAPNNTEPFAAAAHTVVTLAENDVLSLWVAAKLASDITIVNGRVTLTLVEAA